MTSGNIPQSRFRITRLGVALSLTILAVFLWAAISIPLRHSELRANEAAAVNSLRTIHSAQPQRFSCSFANSHNSGYIFAITNCDRERYTITAVPEQKGKTGIRAYCMNESGTVRFSRSGNAQDCLSRGELLH